MGGKGERNGRGGCLVPLLVAVGLFTSRDQLASLWRGFVDSNSISGLPTTVSRWAELFDAASNEAIRYHRDEVGDLPAGLWFAEIKKDMQAIVWSESSGDNNAVSEAGAVCMAQLMPGESFALNPGEPVSLLIEKPDVCLFRATLHFSNLLINAYQAVGGDLSRARRLAAARYYLGGSRVSIDENSWSEEAIRYVRVFESARAGKIVR